MTAYCALADLLKAREEAVLVQLTDDDGLGVVNTAVVDEAIDRAGGEIDTYAGRQYATPLSPVPDIIRDAAVVLTLCRLYNRRQGPPESLLTERSRVTSWLKDLAAGRVGLGEGDPAGTPPSSAADIDSSGRIFSRDTLEGF